MKKLYVILVQFPESGVWACLCARENCLAMQILDGEPAELTRVNSALMFPTVKAAQEYWESEDEPKRKEFFGYFEGQYRIVPADEITVH